MELEKLSAKMSYNRLENYYLQFNEIKYSNRDENISKVLSFNEMTINKIHLRTGLA